MKILNPLHALREGVRLRAFQLFQDGWSLTHIARTLRVTLSAVSQWMKRAREQGEESLRAHPAPGPTPRLTTEQHAQLLSLLRQGAPAHGFEGEVWTASRVAHLIATTFGVHYSDRHVRRLLIQLKWSHQTPATRAAKRDESAIERWRTQRYPELKKICDDEDRTLVFIDECGLNLLPGVVKTWAPRGERPILREGNPYTHLSVISAITPDDALYFQIRDTSFDSEGIIAFLNELHQQISGKVLVIWDGASIHRSAEIKQYLSGGATEWLQLERLPGYAPDLNPDEGIWNHLKYVELKNQCFQTVRRLEAAAREALSKMQQHAAEIIIGCFTQARLC